jgi:hypothetical protein
LHVQAAGRHDSAERSCYLLRTVFLQAVGQAPASSRAQGLAFINAPTDPLHNCNAYARTVVR